MISSRKNPSFRRLRDAIRHHEDEIVLEGPKAIHDAVARGWTPLMVAVDRSGLTLPGKVQTVHLDPSLFAELTDTATSQGMVGLFRRFETPLEEMVRSAGVLVVLDGVQDPGNVGTILRLAAAFDASGVILTEGSADPFGPKAIRASAGTVLHVATCRASRRELLAALQRHNIELWAATTDGQPATLPADRIAITFGSEGKGIDPQLLEGARLVSIPMSNRVESLNVAAAAAVLLSRSYDRRRGTFSAEGPKKEKRNAG
jgi:TrmH family RNA methyltransferase